MKKSEMAEALMIILLPWPNIVVSEPLVNLWCLAFPDETPEQFLAAGVAALKVGNKGFPITIEHVSEMLISLKQPLHEKMTEGEVWGLLMQAVSSFGRFRQAQAFKYLKEQNERVAVVAQQLGWSVIADWRREDLGINRAHFWKMYQAIQQRDKREDTIGVPRTSTMIGTSGATQIDWRGSVQSLINETTKLLGGKRERPTDS